MKILVVCTGNSCRSQMAEGILKKLLPESEIISAGTNPEINVSKYAIEVMKEINIDISANCPKNVDNYLNNDWDFLITLSTKAYNKSIDVERNIKKKLHIDFEDPANAIGSNNEILTVYRKVRNQIHEQFTTFVKAYIY